MSLKGKTAVITGGTSGIGLGTARNCLEEEAANLILLDICENVENVQQLKDQFPAANIVYLSTDITKRDVVDQTFDHILSLVSRIDVVVNCAGVFCDTDLDRTISVNLIGCINISLAALNAMSKVNGGNGGVVVNVASVAGLVPIALSPFYNASKHGVIGFTRTLANDCYFAKYGVKFITVCPGGTMTPMMNGPIVLNKVFPGSQKEIMESVANNPHQTAEQCGRNIVILAASGQNGTVCILDDGKIDEVSIPEYWQPKQEIRTVVKNIATKTID